MKLELLKLGLKKIVDDLDAGNTNVTDDQCEEIFDIIRKSHPKYRMSYYESAQYLEKSRKSIDYYIQQGWLKPRSQPGFVEKFFYREDLDKFKYEHNK